jgi:hypothetical protein
VPVTLLEEFYRSNHPRMDKYAGRQGMKMNAARRLAFVQQRPRAVAQVAVNCGGQPLALLALVARLSISDATEDAFWIAIAMTTWTLFVHTVILIAPSDRPSSEGMPPVRRVLRPFEGRAHMALYPAGVSLWWSFWTTAKLTGAVWPAYGVALAAGVISATGWMLVNRSISRHAIATQCARTDATLDDGRRVDVSLNEYAGQHPAHRRATELLTLPSGERLNLELALAVVLARGRHLPKPTELRVWLLAGMLALKGTPAPEVKLRCWTDWRERHRGDGLKERALLAVCLEGDDPTQGVVAVVDLLPDTYPHTTDRDAGSSRTTSRELQYGVVFLGVGAAAYDDAMRVFLT